MFQNKNKQIKEIYTHKQKTSRNYEIKTAKWIDPSMIQIILEDFELCFLCITKSEFSLDQQYVK
jgi:hypothetical protein